MLHYWFKKRAFLGFGDSPESTKFKKRNFRNSGTVPAALWPTSQVAGLIQTGKLAVDSAIEPYLYGLSNDIFINGDVKRGFKPLIDTDLHGLETEIL
jgi:hypothetical protein